LLELVLKTGTDLSVPNPQSFKLAKYICSGTERSVPVFKTSSGKPLHMTYPGESGI